MHLHGSLGREAATGRGTVIATRELLKAMNAGSIAGKKIVIQVDGPCQLCPPLRFPSTSQVCACHVCCVTMTKIRPRHHEGNHCID